MGGVAVAVAIHTPIDRCVWVSDQWRWQRRAGAWRPPAVGSAANLRSRIGGWHRTRPRGCEWVPVPRAGGELAYSHFARPPSCRDLRTGPVEARWCWLDLAGRSSSSSQDGRVALAGAPLPRGGGCGSRVWRPLCFGPCSLSLRSPWTTRWDWRIWGRWQVAVRRLGDCGRRRAGPPTRCWVELSTRGWAVRLVRCDAVFAVVSLMASGLSRRDVDIL